MKEIFFIYIYNFKYFIIKINRINKISILIDIKNKAEPVHTVPIDKEFLKKFVNRFVKEKIDINNKEEVNKQAANVLNQLKKINSKNTSKFIEYIILI